MMSIILDFGSGSGIGSQQIFKEKLQDAHLTDLLSPQSAAALLTENPADAARILARLDIEACRFVPTVDSAGKPIRLSVSMSAGFRWAAMTCPHSWRYWKWGWIA